MKRNDKLKQQRLSELPNLKVHGRTNGELSPLTLFWTGSGLELNLKGSELWIEVEADYDSYEPWVTLLVNSEPVSRQMITAGRSWICVFRGMNENTVKNVRLVKEVQAMSGDAGALLQIHGVSFDGEFLPVEEKPYKIEFIGDSITSGEGAIGAKVEEDWISMWFSSVSNYTAFTAEALSADYRVISQSGWGVLTGWDNNPNNSLPKYYDQVCGLLQGDRNAELGAHKPNAFKDWEPDVVVVNLGTNDGGAFFSPEWKEEATGRVCKQRLKEDGTCQEEDLRAFETAVFEFLVTLRRLNQRAHIVWAYGMLGNFMLEPIRRGVEAYRNASGDQRVAIVELPDTTAVTVGSRQHPGILAHKAAAEVLTGYLKGLLL